MTGVSRVLRGPAPSRLLARCGVDAKRYWLLMDLFHAISERGEMMDQLGRNGVALGSASVFYGVLSALIGVMAVLVQPRPAGFLAGMVFFTAFLLLAVLLSEAGNSLINPSEGLVLAHQPITGATYTAAKLSHLLRIVFWLVPALNGIPSIAGLFLKGAPWYYPVLHLGAALAAGLLMALLCCAAFGWLMRFIPAKRLKAVGQFAGAVPFLAMPWMSQLVKIVERLRLKQFLPADPNALRALIAACALAAIAIVVLGIRSLSGDYLIRVSAMMRGGARGGGSARRSWTGGLVARLAGGQAARAGFGFVSRLMRRDWQFRRQLLATAAPLGIALGSSMVKGWSVDPFSSDFSAIHLFPHATGALTVMMAVILPYGSDYKGSWIFLLASPEKGKGFAAGAFAVLAEVALALHLIMAPLLFWRWGPVHAAIFLAFSVAATSVYIGLAMRLVDAIPFTRQPNPTRAAMTLPMVLGGMFVIGLAVAIQHFVLFRFMPAVAAATVLLAIAGGAAAVTGVADLATAMSHQMAEDAGEAGTLYREVNV
jgi:hypothetical protein